MEEQGFILLKFKHEDLGKAWDYVDAVERYAEDLDPNVILVSVTKEVE